MSEYLRLLHRHHHHHRCRRCRHRHHQIHCGLWTKEKKKMGIKIIFLTYNCVLPIFGKSQPRMEEKCLIRPRMTPA